MLRPDEIEALIALIHSSSTLPSSSSVSKSFGQQWKGLTSLFNSSLRYPAVVAALRTLITGRAFRTPEEHLVVFYFAYKLSLPEAVPPPASSQSAPHSKHAKQQQNSKAKNNSAASSSSSNTSTPMPLSSTSPIALLSFSLLWESIEMLERDSEPLQRMLQMALFAQQQAMQSRAPVFASLPPPPSTKPDEFWMETERGRIRTLQKLFIVKLLMGSITDSTFEKLTAKQFFVSNRPEELEELLKNKAVLSKLQDLKSCSEKAYSSLRMGVLSASSISALVLEEIPIPLDSEKIVAADAEESEQSPLSWEDEADAALAEEHGWESLELLSRTFVPTMERPVPLMMDIGADEIQWMDADLHSISSFALTSLHSLPQSSSSTPVIPKASPSSFAAAAATPPPPSLSGEADMLLWWDFPLAPGSSSSSSSSTSPPPSFASLSSGHSNGIGSSSSSLVQNEALLSTPPTQPSAEMADLISKSYRQRLPPKEQQQVLNLIQADSRVAQSYFGLTPKRLTELVENNPTVAAEVLLQLITSPVITDYLTALVNMDVGLHGLEVVNRLATSVDLPKDFLHVYISHCITSCENMKDKSLQNRVARLLCVFLQSLLNTNAVNVRDVYLEVQTFCVAFSRLKEASTLFRTLKSLSDE